MSSKNFFFLRNCEKAFPHPCPSGNFCRWDAGIFAVCLLLSTDWYTSLKDRSSASASSSVSALISWAEFEVGLSLTS